MSHTALSTILPPRDRQHIVVPALEGAWQFQPLLHWPNSFKISTGWQLPFAGCYHLPFSSPSSWGDSTRWLFQMHVTRISSTCYWLTETCPKVSTESSCSSWCLYFSFFHLLLPCSRCRTLLKVLEKNTNNISSSIFSLTYFCVIKILRWVFSSGSHLWDSEGSCLSPGQSPS